MAVNKKQDYQLAETPKNIPFYTRLYLFIPSLYHFYFHHNSMLQALSAYGQSQNTPLAVFAEMWISNALPTPHPPAINNGHTTA
jgi:hypothetical protein